MYHIETPLSSGFERRNNPMISIEIKDHDASHMMVKCGIEGNMKTLTREAIEVVHCIYKAMAEDGGPEPALALFRQRFVMAALDPLSPMWDLSSSEVVGRGDQEAEGKEGQP